MNKSELTAKMLEWEFKKNELDALESQIKNEVMHMEESFDAGNVHARFTGGRKTFDYKGAAKSVPAETIEPFTITVITTDWKAVCDYVGIKEIPFTTGNPSVSLSIK